MVIITKRIVDNGKTFICLRNMMSLSSFKREIPEKMILWHRNGMIPLTFPDAHLFYLRVGIFT